jgi:hypothetical protein
VEQLEPRNLMAIFSGYSPAQELAAYGYNQLGIAQPGLGKTIAIVDAYLAPNIATDVATFDSTYGLPAVNLSVLNDGATRADPTGGWELETALDVEWAHAVAPYAKIVLVEAANDSVTSASVPTALLHSVTLAASSTVAANVVSMSWGLAEFKSETSYDSTFNVPGVTFVAAAGDNGAQPIWPATSPNVVAVGGTSLAATSTAGVYTETTWSGGGGGVSTYESQPAYQKESYTSSVTAAQNPGGKRTIPDVSFLADPNTGVSVYEAGDGGWYIVGGTSAGSPQIAATVALADQVGKTSLSSAQTLAAAYNEQADFYDITSGSNGYAAGTGYDLASGLGSPIANQWVTTLAAQGTAHGVTSTDPLRAAPSSGGTGGTGSGGGGHHHHNSSHGFRDSTTGDDNSAQIFFLPFTVNSAANANDVVNSAASSAQALQTQNSMATGQSVVFQTVARTSPFSLFTPPSLCVGETFEDQTDVGEQPQPPALPVPVPGGQQPGAGQVPPGTTTPGTVPQAPRAHTPDIVPARVEAIVENESDSVSENVPTAVAAVVAALGFVSFRTPAQELAQDDDSRQPSGNRKR